VKKIIFITIIAALILGCASVTNLQPKENELVLKRQFIPDISLAEVQKGFKLYKFNCSGCHYLHRPDEYIFDRWERILPEMFNRAKLSSDKDQRLIKYYLIVKSK